MVKFDTPMPYYDTEIASSYMDLNTGDCFFSIKAVNIGLIRSMMKKKLESCFVTPKLDHSKWRHQIQVLRPNYKF